MDEICIRDFVFGNVTCYAEFKSLRDMVEIVAYVRSPESHYRIYLRNEITGEVDGSEVDWRGYIIGARSHRLDFELSGQEWQKMSKTEKKVWILEQIQKEFDTDNIFGFHVERVSHPEEWDDMADDELWAVEKETHKRLGDLELQIRDARRQHQLVWALGDRKFDWADNL